MNVLERIAKNLQECTSLGLSASQASSLSIFDSKVIDKYGCNLLLTTGTPIPEIIEKTFNREVISGLHYYSHPDYTTTFIFSVKS